MNGTRRVRADEGNCINVNKNRGKALELVSGAEGKEGGKERELRSTSGGGLEDTVLSIDSSRGERNKIKVKTDDGRGFPPLAGAPLGRRKVTECIQEDCDSSGKPFGTRKRPRVPFSPTQQRRHLDDPKISVVSRGTVRELPPTVASGSDENVGNETVGVSTSCNGFRGLGLDSCIENFAVQSGKGLGLTTPTACQSLAIPAIMSGKNVIIKSETGSGKTLAYLLPLVSLMSTIDPKVTRDMGTLAIVIAPTRELAVQISSVLNRILYRRTWIVGGCISGGEKRKSEKARIRRGVNIMVATPGRLLDHLRSTQSFKLVGLRWMVLDEVDRLVDLGFMQQVQSILQLIETNRQSVADSATPLRTLQSIMASATLPPEIKSLGASFFGGGHVVLDSTTKKIVNVPNSLLTEGETDESQQFETPKQLVQLHMVVPQKLRLVALCAFLRRLSISKNNMKAIIFFSTCDSVNFHHDLLQKAVWPQKNRKSSFIERCHSLNSNCEKVNRAENGNQTTVLAPQSSTMDKELVLPSNVPVMKLHGNISQSERSSAYKNFFSASQAVLLCTDVAARGLDLPEVDWIVQYDPPAEISDYIHRVGRTARRGRGGYALLFVLPTESELVGALSQKGLRLTALSLQATFQDALGQRGGGGENLSFMLQDSIQDVLKGSPDTLAKAKAAFQSHVRAYGTKRADIRSMFQVRKLHLGHVARSFALQAVPTTLGKVENHRSDSSSSSRLKQHWHKCKQNRKVIQCGGGGKNSCSEGEVSGLQKLSPLTRKKKRFEKQQHSDISEFGS